MTTKTHEDANIIQWKVEASDGQVYEVAYRWYDELIIIMSDLTNHPDALKIATELYETAFAEAFGTMDNEDDDRYIRSKTACTMPVISKYQDVKWLSTVPDVCWSNPTPHVKYDYSNFLVGYNKRGKWEIAYHRTTTIGQQVSESYHVVRSGFATEDEARREAVRRL